MHFNISYKMLLNINQSYMHRLLHIVINLERESGSDTLCLSVPESVAFVGRIVSHSSPKFISLGRIQMSQKCGHFFYSRVLEHTSEPLATPLLPKHLPVL